MKTNHNVLHRISNSMVWIPIIGILAIVFQIFIAYPDNEKKTWLRKTPFYFIMINGAMHGLCVGSIISHI